MLWQVVLNKVAADFRLHTPVKMMHLNDVSRQPLAIWASSPGLPYRNYGYTTKQQVRDDPTMMNNIRWFWHNIKTGKRQVIPDCCAYVRSHLAPVGEEKIRAVWGYPMAVTLGEAVFALPLIRAYGEVGRYPIAYGYETANGGTRRVVKRFSSRRNIWALDYSSFDKHVPAWLINAAFFILEQNIDFLHYQEYGTTNVDGILRMWTAIKNYFIYTPIRLPNGERYRKTCGVASGSYFTQLVDSIVNALLVCYLSMRVTGSWPDDYIVFGDDSLVSFKRNVQLAELSLVLREFGLSFNIRKSFQSDRITDLEFLGYRLENAIPSKEHSKWIYALLYPEHPDLNWDQVASRALGLYYANLGVDGKFSSLCSRIINHCSFDLHLSKSMVKMLRVAGFRVNTLGRSGLPNEFKMFRDYIYKE